MPGTHTLIRRTAAPLARRVRSVLAGAVVALHAGIAGGQNVVADAADRAVVPPVNFAPGQLTRFLEPPAERPGPTNPANARRVSAKLARHVEQFLDGYPYLPFHHTLGISGSETYFDHPDEMFYALAVATPHLAAPLARRAQAFLASQLSNSPPYGLAGFAQVASGTPRESYRVPEALRRREPRPAHSAFGVFAFWAYCEYAGGRPLLDAHWKAVQDRMRPLLSGPVDFDPTVARERDEAEVFTGNLSGMIGYVRLARMMNDTATATAAASRALGMLQVRLDLERQNPDILSKSTRASSHSLHHYKLARYLDMAPSVAAALAELTEGVAATRLRTFRQARNAWHIAYGPRLVGGENYTSPPHFSRALFDTAALIERVSPDQLLEWVDVPWCPGDFYFIIKCSYALGAAK